MSKKIKCLLIIVAIEIVAIAGLLAWAIAAAPSQGNKGKSTTTAVVTLKTPKITPVLFASGLTTPTVIATPLGTNDSKMYVAQQGGVIQSVNQKGKLGTQPFLDIASKVQNNGEMGLLGLAFHPKYSQNGYFFVNYIDKDQNTIIARYKLNVQSGTADPASEKILVRVKQPYANHNGGALQFGRDGYLYAALGDGGSSGDPENRSQDKNSLFGKILRLDVNTGDPYAIPANNPFATTSGVKPEIWALGLRNPWRFIFYRLTGDMYIADVGQGNIEELDFQKAASKGGENYGWRCYEGSTEFNITGCQAKTTYVAPVIEYDHSEKRCAITGGYIYRGTAQKALASKYFYADYCGGQLYYTQQSAGIWKSTLAASTPYSISTFGEDAAGELYFADLETGNIYHVTDTANK
jgi:glucose/arabinose dehydrogenase